MSRARTAGSRLLQSALPIVHMTVGLGLLGIGSYVVLVGVGRAVSPRDLAAFAAFWAASFGIVLGVFVPFEQMVVRAVAAADSETPSPPRRVVALYAGVVVVGTATLVLAADPIANRFFAGHTVMSYALAAYVVVCAAEALQRGGWAGRRQFARYGRQLGVEGGARVAVGIAAWLAGGSQALTVAAFGTVAAALVALAATGWPFGRPWRLRETTWPTVLKDAGSLTLASTIGTVIMNIGPAAALALGAPSAAAGAFAAVFIIVRIPLFFFGTTQSLLIPRLSRAWEEHDPVALRRGAGLAVAVVGAAGFAVALVLGAPADEWARVLFSRSYSTGVVPDLALALSTTVFLLIAVAQAVLIAIARTPFIGASWVAGAVCFGAVLAAAPLDPIPRIVAAYDACAVLTIVAQAVAIRWGLQSRSRQGSVAGLAAGDAT